MAYISTERVKEIRAELKKEFPELKLSVKQLDHAKVIVTILSGPYDFFSMINKESQLYIECGQPENYSSVNHYYINDQWIGKACEVFNKIKSIAAKGSFDLNAGDIYADYCDYTFYFGLRIGTREKPYTIK